MARISGVEPPLGQVGGDLLAVDGIHDDHHVRLQLDQVVGTEDLVAGARHEITLAVGIDVHRAGDSVIQAEGGQERHALGTRTPDHGRLAVGLPVLEPARARNPAGAANRAGNPFTQPGQILQLLGPGQGALALCPRCSRRWSGTGRRTRCRPRWGKTRAPGTGGPANGG